MSLFLKIAPTNPVEQQESGLEWGKKYPLLCPSEQRKVNQLVWRSPCGLKSHSSGLRIRRPNMWSCNSYFDHDVEQESRGLSGSHHSIKKQQENKPPSLDRINIIFSFIGAKYCMFFCKYSDSSGRTCVSSKVLKCFIHTENISFSLGMIILPFIPHCLLSIYIINS